MKNLEVIDEIIERFERNAEFQRTHGDLSGCQEFKQLAEWLKELKAYKEQQPCEDAISREATIKYLNTNMAWYDEDGEIADSEEKIRAITDLVNGVPPCIPEHKTGKWNVLGLDDLSDVHLYKCSECHAKITLKFNYCPHCGAKMESPE